MVDGHVLLQQDSAGWTTRDAIVVVDVAGRRYGLRVGQVLDFLEVPEAPSPQRGTCPGVDPAAGEGRGPP